MLVKRSKMPILFSLARKKWSLCQGFISRSQKNIQQLVEFSFAKNFQCHGPKLQDYEAMVRLCKAYSKLNCLSALSPLFFGNPNSNPTSTE